jgi:tetratricopeptide (TPR) repeat protein
VSINWRLGMAIAVFGIVGAGSASTAFAQTGGCSGNGKMSKQIAKPMSAAKDAMKVKKWQEVLARTREAAAMPITRTAWDQYWINEFNGYAYSQLGQYGEAAKAYEAAVESACQPEAQKGERFKALANLYYSLRNYPKVIDYATRALKYGRDPEVLVTLGQAYYQSNDNKNALRIMNDVLASFEQRGATPKEQQLLLVLSACQRVNDNNCVTRLFEKLVLHYPKSEYWQNLLANLIQSDLKDEQKINVMRLAMAVDVMKRPDQYKEMAQIALDQGLPGEAQSVLEQAFEKKLFKEQRDIDLNTRLLNKAKSSVATDKPTLAQKDAAARTSPTGDDDVKLGAAYLSYGETDKAVEAIKRGVTQGSMKNPDEAGILLGIAYLKANNKPEAAKAFRTVKQDPTMARIAKLWLLNT